MSETARRLRVVCRGVVQGVGFRPTVHRVATDLGLSGWVRNSPEGVVIEVEGGAGGVAAFAERSRNRSHRSRG